MAKGKMIYVAQDDAKLLTKLLIRERKMLIEVWQANRDSGGMLSKINRVNHLIENKFNLEDIDTDEIYKLYGGFEG